MVKFTAAYWSFISRLPNESVKNLVYCLGSPLPLKCIAACFITAVSFWGYSSNSGLGAVVLAALTGWFAAASWLHYDDLWDQEIDQVNHPMRPLASGNIRLESAIKATAASFLLAAGAAYLLGLRAFGFTLVHLGLALIYPTLLGEATMA